MRVAIVLLLAIVPFVFSSLAKAGPPSNVEGQIETTSDDGIGQTLRMILKRLNDIETRLSRMEQRLASMRDSAISSENVEWGMKLDAIERDRERERSLGMPLEEEIRPSDGR